MNYNLIRWYLLILADYSHRDIPEKHKTVLRTQSLFTVKTTGMKLIQSIEFSVSKR